LGSLFYGEKTGVYHHKRKWEKYNHNVERKKKVVETQKRDNRQNKEIRLKKEVRFFKSFSVEKLHAKEQHGNDEQTNVPYGGFGDKDGDFV